MDGARPSAIYHIGCAADPKKSSEDDDCVGRNCSDILTHLAVDTTPDILAFEEKDSATTANVSVLKTRGSVGHFALSGIMNGRSTVV